MSIHIRFSMSIPNSIEIPSGILTAMAKQTRTDRAIRDAGDEIRRETRSAAAEVRLELAAAKRETGAALREAMVEVRAALAEDLGAR